MLAELLLGEITILFVSLTLKRQNLAGRVGMVLSRIDWVNPAIYTDLCYLRQCPASRVSALAVLDTSLVGHRLAEPCWAADVFGFEDLPKSVGFIKAT